MSFNPQDNTQMCVIGNNVYKMYRYSDGALKNFASLKQENFNLTSHTWLSDERVLVGTNRAELLLIQNGEIIHDHTLFDVKDGDG